MYSHWQVLITRLTFRTGFANLSLRFQSIAVTILTLVGVGWSRKSSTSFSLTFRSLGLPLRPLDFQNVRAWECHPSEDVCPGAHWARETRQGVGLLPVCSPDQRTWSTMKMMETLWKQICQGRSWKLRCIIKRRTAKRRQQTNPCSLWFRILFGSSSRNVLDSLDPSWSGTHWSQGPWTLLQRTFWWS